jgi:hypothetical protein
MWMCSVQLDPAADGTLGVIQGCTKLTKLELSSTDVIDGATGAVVDSLSRLVHLQHLSSYLWAWQTYKHIRAFSEATMPRLVQLTHLHVENLSRKNLVQLGGLTNLQQLCLMDDKTEEPVYDDGDAVILFGPGTLPGLAFPASLTQLVLIEGEDASILSLVPPGLKHLNVQGPVSGPTEGPGSLLSYISALQQLTELGVFLVGYGWPTAGHAYSSLTASSHLASLELSHTPPSWRGLAVCVPWHTSAASPHVSRV